ncbi:hypothetical protein VPHD518_0093 [Vibrio phage D518]
MHCVYLVIALRSSGIYLTHLHHFVVSWMRVYLKEIVMSKLINWEFKIGDIVRLPNEQGKGVIVGRKCIEDAEGVEFVYDVFNKRTEHSTEYSSNELMKIHHTQEA